jgi:Uma2 family endonuclease
MSAVATRYLELVEKLPPGSVLILNNVSWDDYENLLEELEGQRHVQISYDQGRMEIMTLSFGHEKWKSFFTHVIQILTEETGLPMISGGQVTLRREAAGRGKEPDDCFYIHHADAVRGKEEIDLTTDPPPDLAVEVDISNPSVSRFPIYVSIGVPEIWLFDGQSTRFYRLAENDYLEIPASDLFPFLTPAVMTDFLRLGDSEDINAMRRAFREWVRANTPSPQA